MTFFFPIRNSFTTLTPTAKRIHQLSSKVWPLKVTCYVIKVVLLLLLFSEKRENCAL